MEVRGRRAGAGKACDGFMPDDMLSRHLGAESFNSCKQFRLAETLLSGYNFGINLEIQQDRRIIFVRPSDFCCLDYRSYDTCMR